jgi:hypothetical protein
MAYSMRQVLIDLDEQWAPRLLKRLESMTDDEYLWEPVPDAWSVRTAGDGTWEAEWSHPEPDPAPFTTIAARLWHLGARPWSVPAARSVDEAVERQFVSPYAPPGHSGREACGSSADAARSIDQQRRSRREVWESLSDDELAGQLGRRAHIYGETSWFDLELHHLDEHIHHAAEVALLRDLYRVRNKLRRR